MPDKKPIEAMEDVPEIAQARDEAPSRLAEMLDIARRHVIQGKRAIVEQRERVEALRREGREAAGAERRLADLEATMRSMQEHVAIDDEARGRPPETRLLPLERARRDIMDAVHRVGMQRARVERMRRSGHDVRSAERLLDIYHAMLRALRERHENA